MVRKWQFDLDNCNRQQAAHEPNGYNKSFVVESTASGRALSKDAEKTIQLKQKRAMDIAWAPGKSLFMTGFMMYMSGSTVHIFSIMITAMALFNPIKALFAINNAFTSVNDSKIDLTQPKLVFVAMNLIALSMALYKCGTMGLLPTTSADWTWLLPLRQAVEASVQTISL